MSSKQNCKAIFVYCLKLINFCYFLIFYYLMVLHTFIRDILSLADKGICGDRYAIANQVIMDCSNTEFVNS